MTIYIHNGDGFADASRRNDARVQNVCDNFFLAPSTDLTLPDLDKRQWQHNYSRYIHEEMDSQGTELGTFDLI